MNFGFSSISARTQRLIILSAGAILLMAAGVPQTDTFDGSTGPTISDDILAPLSPAEAAASAAALAATTPAEIAVADLSDDSNVTEPGVRPAKLTALIASLDAADAVASDSELRCLATAVYFESRGEPLEGQLAVAQAIINRAESGRYPSNICGVINQPKQFSYNRSRVPTAGSDWRIAQAIAQIAAKDMWVEVAPKALSFHATYVAPNWAGKTRVATIGRHVFYR
ncbi:cell wall hydrolase [Sandarakinorhabdus sp. DWP1-3-1]|uniref:cell wall hydrolase n=1 Tax=Sandarakinorhabdus sp. DWP1-3-1 TaxID=2804627 RepID=UPI003CF363A2